MAPTTSAGAATKKHNARIKIAPQEEGVEAFCAAIAGALKPCATLTSTDQPLSTSLKTRFARPDLNTARATTSFYAARANDPGFRAWSDVNLRAHAVAGQAIAVISLKIVGRDPGDAAAQQMRHVATLARRFAHGDIRAGFDQNLILPHVHLADMPALHDGLRAAGLATANAGLASEIVACPGMDYCSLATARAIPVAQQIATRLEPIECMVGLIGIRISGCINACGHHHLGDIGLLGLEKAGGESYQVTLGGRPGTDMAIGTRAGPSFGAHEIVAAVERAVLAWVALPEDGARFADTLDGLGISPLFQHSTRRTPMPFDALDLSAPRPRSLSKPECSLPRRWPNSARGRAPRSQPSRDHPPPTRPVS